MANQIQANGLATLRGVLANETMKRRFEEILKESAGAFMASIIELYQGDSYLQKCSANAVVLEALKAATLKLPINKALGFAYIIPYGSTPTFVIGYKGLIQLAMRSGQYRYINADVVCEGEEIHYNRVTGALEIQGVPKSDKVIGYFAYFQLLNGFEKAIYWTRERVTEHAQKYSKSFSINGSAWKTNFDDMALKTVLRRIISKYGVMSVEFAEAVAHDNADERIEAEARANANSEPLEIPTDFADSSSKDSAAGSRPDAAADLEPGF